MDKSWDTFEFLGRFPIHTYSSPPLIPQTTLDACFQNFFPSLLLKDRVLICRDAITERSILAQYLIPYFIADISLFPTADRLTQISLYISLLHHDLQSTVAKLKIKKPSEYLLHLFTSTNVTISNLRGVN